jgi:valine dehydrogenase (NAD+)
VVVADVEKAAVERLQAEHPGVSAVAPEDLPALDLDVFSPCALGSALDRATVGRLRARVVCGGANNQLAEPGIDALLHERGVLYAPDYVVNAGGLIQVASEVYGYDVAEAERRTAAIYARTGELLEVAAAEGIAPARAADLMAERRIAAGGGVFVPAAVQGKGYAGLVGSTAWKVPAGS